MKEDLLHFIWRCDKLQGRPLTTSTSEHIVIKNPGTLNRFAGPDFFNAKVEVGGQLWAGNVEMHLKSSDWYAHHHEMDANYDNVILHVVWDDDIQVFRRDGTCVPTLELKHYIAPTLLLKYQELFRHFNPSFIQCERDFGQFDPFLVETHLERLYIERLEQKSELILLLLGKTNNDWEAVLFVLLAKNFGTKINGDFFLKKATEIGFSVIRKLGNDLDQLESVLFGHFGLLEVENCVDSYYLGLRQEYGYLAQKFQLARSKESPEFFGLRPANFPTVRLSQLGNLYAGNIHLFSKLMEGKNVGQLYDLLEATSSAYWENHFTFGKRSRKSQKKLSKKFKDLIIINTLLPLRFCYARHLGKEADVEVLELISEIKGEVNSIVTNFDTLGFKTKNALQSQAKIQLYTKYCSKNKCLQCTLGAHLLNRNT